MKYSIERREWKYIQGFDFLSFAKKFGDRHDKKLMEIATKTVKNTWMDAAKTNSKRAVQKTAKQLLIWLEIRYFIKLLQHANQRVKKGNKTMRWRKRKKSTYHQKDGDKIFAIDKIVLCTHKNGIWKNYESIRQHKGYSTNI